MEICPDAPGFVDRLRRWQDGCRDPLDYLAVFGTSIIVVLAFVATITILHG